MARLSSDLRMRGSSLSDLIGSLSQHFKEMARVINGNISFGDGTDPGNIDGVWVSATTDATPSTDFIVTHNLGRVPVGFFVVDKTANLDVWRNGAATTTALTLRSDVGSETILLFIF